MRTGAEHGPSTDSTAERFSGLVSLTSRSCNLRTLQAKLVGNIYIYIYIIRVRVKERIITVPGQAIGQGSGPRPFVTCGGGAPNGPPKKLIGAGVSKF